MMIVLLTVSGALDAFRKRAGRNVFWFAFVAALTAAVVVALLLFHEPTTVAVHPPALVATGELRRAQPVAPATPTPAAPVPRAPSAPPVPPLAPENPKQAAAAPAPAETPLVLTDTRERKPEAKAPLPELRDPAPAAAPGPLYQVQLGAFLIEARAQRLARRATRAGFPAAVTRDKTAGGKLFYRVRIKAAMPKEAADALQAKLKEKIPALDPIVVARDG